MFNPISITDSVGDTTTVGIHDREIRIKVEDQCAPALDDDAKACAYGVYTAAQARELIAALTAAVEHLESETYTLVDSQGYLWFFNKKGFWHCALDLRDARDEFTDWSGPSAFPGLDEGAAGVIESFGVAE